MDVAPSFKALIQKKPGYVPESALSKEKILCQRCYKLMHYHQKMESHLTKDDFLHVLQTVGEKDCLVVYIVDLFDFNGSLVPGLMRHIGYNDVLVLANKRDILPKSLKEHRLNTWVRRQFKEYGIKPLDVVITSGKKNMNFDEIFDKIDEYRHGRDVYVVGITNVGKSTFINRMLKNYSDASNLITTSEFPGTTLDLIKIPLDDHSSLYDTPGIMNEHQYTSVVDEKDLAYIMPQGEVKPMIYQLMMINQSSLAVLQELIIQREIKETSSATSLEICRFIVQRLKKQMNCLIDISSYRFMDLLYQ